MGCCSLGEESFLPDYEQWGDHPARQQYEVLKDLGQGSFSKVVLARNKQTQELVALKVCFLDGPDVDAEHLEVMLREADYLNMLDHPNIVTCKDVIRNRKQLVLVLEWLRGGQVIDKLFEIGPQYTEQTACEIFSQMAEAVAFMHEYNILHRDIKPENVMWVEPPSSSGMPTPVGLTVAQLQQRQAAAKSAAKGVAPGGGRLPRIKLIDLGMALLYSPDKPVCGALGSAGFVAPEVVKGHAHTPAMDVFSLGVLLFVMLVGRKPFNVKETETLQYAIMRLGDGPGFKDPRWLDLSPDAKDLIMGMMAYDPARRLTAQQVCQHEWVVSRGGKLPRQLADSVAYGAATVASVRRLRHLCGGVVTLQRATQAAASCTDGSTGGWRRRGGSAGSSAREAFLRQQRLAARREASWRGGGAMDRLARSLAAKSYARMHDEGGTVHPSEDISVHFAAAGTASRDPTYTGPRPAADAGAQRARAGGLAGGSTSGRWRLARAVVPSMRRTATTVLLSEMDRSRSTAPGGTEHDRGNRSVHVGIMRRPSAPPGALPPTVPRPAGSTHGAPMPPTTPRATVPLDEASSGSSSSGSGVLPDVAAAAPPAAPALLRRPSSMQLLAAATKQYLAQMEGSRHSVRSGSSMQNMQSLHGAQAAAAAAADVGAAAVPGDKSAPGAGQLHAAASSGRLAPGSSSRELSIRVGTPSLPGGSPLDRSFSSCGGSFFLDNADPGGRPLRRVQRRSFENPLAAPGSPAAVNRTWDDVQATLKYQSPRNNASRDGTTSGNGAANTRVKLLKPL